MRLSEIFYKISSLTIEFEDCHLKNEYASNDNYKISNINNLKYLIKEIEEREINFYEEEINFLKKSAIYGTTLNHLYLGQAYAKEVQNKSFLIVTSLISLENVLSRITPERNENSFVIKIPQPRNFEELTKDLTKIQKQINQIVTDPKIDSSANINNWEYGSFWIDIVIGSQAALGLLASITWTAAYISRELKKDKELNLYLERVKHENEHIEKLKETQFKYIEGLYESEILNIQKKHYDDEEDNDRNLKLKNTIKLFADIINRGGEIQPSLIAPEKMKKQFPDLNNIDMIESQIKKITEMPESQKNEQRDIIDEGVSDLNDNADKLF